METFRVFSTILGNLEKKKEKNFLPTQYQELSPNYPHETKIKRIVESFLEKIIRVFFM